MNMELFFEEYLDRLHCLHADCVSAIDGLPQDALDWVPGPEMNSICVLIVHLTGAERYWIGDVVGTDKSDRVREKEFRAQGMDTSALEKRLSDSIVYARGVLDRLTIHDLDLTRISPRDGKEFTIGWALAHVLEHTALHVGHIQITRQLWEHQQED
jgi:uncharacterized damage-inducible protein DinB